MFDTSKAKREPVGKWDSEEQLPRDMSYKQMAQAVSRRIVNARRTIWCAIATCSFAAGVGASLFGLLVSAVLAAALTLLTVVLAVSANRWAKLAKKHLASANDAIQIVEPAEEKPHAKEPLKSAPVALSN